MAGEVGRGVSAGIGHSSMLTLLSPSCGMDKRTDGQAEVVT